jgi:hypothetical protein
VAIILCVAARIIFISSLVFGRLLVQEKARRVTLNLLRQAIKIADQPTGFNSKAGVQGQTRTGEFGD